MKHYNFEKRTNPFNNDSLLRDVNLLAIFNNKRPIKLDIPISVVLQEKTNPVDQEYKYYLAA